MKNIAAFLIACVFSIGLCISGLVSPRKVLAFLDLFGAWDPSLIFTMGGGVLVAGVTYLATRSRNTSLLGEPMQLPANATLDTRLIGGSLLFGIGWGLAGVCPGPAFVNLGFLSGPAAVFVVAMIVGMILYEVSARASASRPTMTVDA